MGALKHLPLRRDYWMRAAATAEAPEQPGSRLDVRLAAATRRGGTS